MTEDEDADAFRNDPDPFRLPAKGASVEDHPVLPPMLKTMEAALVVLASGRVALLHEKLTDEFLAWVEYDGDVNTLTMITWAGRQIPFGQGIPPQMRKALRQAHTITIALVENGKPMSLVYDIPLVVRHIYHRSKPKEQTRGKK